MQAPARAARPLGERAPSPDRDTTTKALALGVNTALPSPPLTREPSLTSTRSVRLARPSDEGAPTAAEQDLADAHQAAQRMSAPFLELSSTSSMGESPAEDAVVLDIGPVAGPSRLPPEVHPLARVPSSPRRRNSIAPWETMDNGDTHNGTLTSADTHAYQTLRTQRSRPLIPKSSYYFGPPPAGSAFGSAPAGMLGTHHPREVLRLERDYSGGELVQFSTVFPLELEGRLTPTQFLESVNTLNEILLSAHSLAHSAFDNALQIFSLQLSRLFYTSHYDKQMRRLRRTIDSLNAELYNPAGLNILWPHGVAFLFLEIEYY